jgi:chemotaxis protein methyltransferase CheR
VLAPEDEGRKLFELVLEWAATGEDHPETEAGLRKALYLAPQLAAARYLLGLILERRGVPADAASEYRRALSMLEAGKATPSAFFLNNERLKQACRVALSRCASFVPRPP